ncbi:MAG TPA: hypothetical protein H9707_09045 [Candidatus Butyricicoccus avicola]|nr:hypothetical protein [Candidatus Butyricicoccus avicola]
MRTGKVTIHGKEYLLCFSTRVLMALEEREGDSQKGLTRILKDEKISDLFWLLEQMIDAGDRYAKIEGIDNPGALSFDQLMDTVGVDEYNEMFGALVSAVSEGNKPKVEVKPGKNAKATASE